MANKQELAQQHSFINDSLFRLKTWLLSLRRAGKNVLWPTPHCKDRGMLANEPTISLSESDLWNPLDNADNWILTAGKIQNLRVAAKMLHGVEIPANQIFSFWKHIGYPSASKGFVVGREIREGCIVPTIAGGLCQLSNALYDAALKAQFDIVERHQHTKIVQGSLAEHNRDATVKWNYVDLRFKSTCDFRIEAILTSQKLIVSFKSKQKNLTEKNTIFPIHSFHQLNDCYACGNTACHKHANIAPQDIAAWSSGAHAFVLDEQWPEHKQYVQTQAKVQDYCIVPLKKNSFIKTDRYEWDVSSSQQSDVLYWQGMVRAIALRIAAKKKKSTFERNLQLDRKIAFAAAKRIPIHVKHIVVSQSLLPFLYEAGALGGRTYDVLMTRLPFETIHKKLDSAFLHHPQSITLNDFRATPAWVQWENQALTQARHIITPHAEIASLFKNKVIQLDWVRPSIATTQAHLPLKRASHILFPASAVGRKGAYEVRRLAQALKLPIKVIGGNIEEDNFWQGVQVEKFNGDWQSIGLIIYPAHIDNQPRLILKALSLSKDVHCIVSPACGLQASHQIQVIAPHDFEQWAQAIGMWKQSLQLKAK